MAPEVIEGNYDEKCDMWSVGCILYTMLTGYPPFNGTCGAEIIAKVSRGKFSVELLEDYEISEEGIALIEKLLDPNPNFRPSALDIMHDPWIEIHKEEAPEEANEAKFNRRRNLFERLLKTEQPEHKCDHTFNYSSFSKNLQNLRIDVKTVMETA